jgi:exosortase/archaeosortase
MAAILAESLKKLWTDYWVFADSPESSKTLVEQFTSNSRNLKITQSIKLLFYATFSSFLPASRWYVRTTQDNVSRNLREKKIEKKLKTRLKYVYLVITRE